MMTLPISAVIVSFNEGHILGNCLSSLHFCDELIVIDLESEDNTEEVAKKFGARYIKHKRVPVVEQIHTWIQDKVKNDWLIISDPDEVCSKELANEIIKFTSEPRQNVGAVSVPMRNYFKKRVLTGTQWGGILSRIFLVNLKGFYFTDDVHRGRHLKNGFKLHEINYDGKNFLHHYWMQNNKQLIEKHLRYLKNEGSSRYNKGDRTSYKHIVKTVYHSFKDSYIKKRGYREGLTGLYLSTFWMWYSTMAQISLLKTQNKIQKNNATNIQSHYALDRKS